MAGSSCNSRGFLYWRADRRSRRPDAEGRGSPMAKLSLSNSSVPGRTLFGREGPHGRTVRCQPADARENVRLAGRAVANGVGLAQETLLERNWAVSASSARGPACRRVRNPASPEEAGRRLQGTRAKGRRIGKKIDVERRVAHEAAAGSWARRPLAAGFPRGPTGLHSGLLRPRFRLAEAVNPGNGEEGTFTGGEGGKPPRGQSLVISMT